MRVWNALIDGPSDTCYEDGLFTLRLEFSGIEKLYNENFIHLFYLRYLSIDTA